MFVVAMGIRDLKFFSVLFWTPFDFVSPCSVPIGTMCFETPMVLKFLARYSTKIFLCKTIGRLKGRVTKVVGEGGTGSGRERWILFTGSVPK